MGSWSALCRQNSIGSSTPSHIIIFVLATKQTLLSINLVNHAMLRLVSDYQFIGPEGHTLDTPKEPQCPEP